MSHAELIKQRGKLVAELRKQTSCKTKLEFCEKYNISISTIKHWERGVPDDVTVKGLNNLVAAFQNEGIECSADFIMSAGSDKGLRENQGNASVIHDFSESKLLQSYHDFLSGQHEFLEFAKLEDESLQPYINKGDVIVGSKLKTEHIQLAYGKVCIVHTINNNTYVKIIGSTSLDNMISLYPTQSKLCQTLLLNLSEILYVAPRVGCFSV